MALISDKSLSLIFPIYNEEDNVVKAIQQASHCLDTLSKDWEVLAVNDGSHDNSGELIDTITQEDTRIKAFHHKVNKGYGAALKTGFKNASKELIFFCDSDLQFHLSEILLCLVWIEQYDMVLGYRFNRKDPLYRRLNAYCWNFLVRFMLGLKARDIDCAFKLFRSNVFKSIKIDAVGAMVNTDILTQAYRMGFKIKEIPVSHFPRQRGKQTGADLKVILNAFKELLRLYSKLKNIDPIIYNGYDRRKKNSIPFFHEERRNTDRRNQDMPINFKDRRKKFCETQMVGAEPPSFRKKPEYQKERLQKGLIAD